MQSNVLKKTELGQAEVLNKQLGLDIRERRVLILVDGSRNLIQVEALIGVPIEGIIQRLVHIGLLSHTGHHRKQRDAVSTGLGSTAFEASMLRKPPAGSIEALDHGLAIDSEVRKTKSREPVAQPMFASPEQAQHSTALSPNGFLEGKTYLVSLVERMTGKSEVLMRHKVQNIRNEQQLFATGEELMQLIKVRATAQTVEEIEDRFIECMNQH